MPSTILKVIREVGISLLLFVVIGVVVAIFFYDKVPYAKIIPESIDYKNIDQSQYEIVGGGVENAVKDTATYESSPTELKQYEMEQRVSTGKVNVFGEAENSSSDLPIEVVQQSTGNETIPGEGEEPTENPEGVSSLSEEPQETVAN